MHLNFQLIIVVGGSEQHVCNGCRLKPMLKPQTAPRITQVEKKTTSGRLWQEREQVEAAPCRCCCRCSSYETQSRWGGRNYARRASREIQSLTSIIRADLFLKARKKEDFPEWNLFVQGCEEGKQTSKQSKLPEMTGVL